MKSTPFPLFSGTLLLGFLLTASSCAYYRVVRYNFPDSDDYRIDPYRTISKPEKTFHFHQRHDEYNLGQKLRITYKYVNNAMPLDNFLELFKTKAFLIIRNDTIIYERYLNGQIAETPVSSFSVLKAILSTLVGRAIHQGHLSGLHQAIGEFLPEELDDGLGQVTIFQLMQHTSGINFTDEIDYLNTDQVLFYYGKNLRKRMSRRKQEITPGEEFHYHSANTLLLSMVLESATEQPLNEYLENQLWLPLGMEAQAQWTVDRKGEKGMIRSYCCFQARARDFAKLGRFWLNDGKWGGQQLIPPGWIDDILAASHPETASYHCGFSRAGSYCDQAYYANGLLGQFIYVVPEKNLIMVRFADRAKDDTSNLWRDAFQQLSYYL